MKLLFSCLMLLMFFSLIFSAHAQISTGNEIGTANLDKDKISVSHHFDEHLKIYGTISEPARGTKITIFITDPNGDPDPSSQQIFTTDVGYFETFKILNWESLRGTYTVLVSSNNKIIGSLLFVVQESDKYPVNIQTPKQTTHDTVLTLNLEKGANPDSIRVFPKYLNDFGTELLFTISGSDEFIEIYIDNQYVTSVKPNQWSGDIVVGYGSHDAYAKSPEFTITGNVDRYLSAKSNPQSIYLQSPTTSGLVAEPAVTTPSAVTDHSEVTISTAPGSNSPGCETASQGCFIPKEATIDVGGKVIFFNTDTAAHTFTAGTAYQGNSGGFDTGLIMAGSSYEWTATTEGQYDYYCMIHPWMTGLIIVQEAGIGKIIVNKGGQVTHLGTNSIEVIENRLVTLGDSGTYDSSTYLWVQTDGEPIILSSYAVAKPQFMAPDVANGQIKVLTFTLIVTDPSGTRDSIIEVVVNPVNHTPMANAGKEIVAGAKYCAGCGHKTNVSTTKITTQKSSNLWYLLPIFLGIVGGIISYFVLRKSDSSKAKNCLLIGIGVFILWSAIQILIPNINTIFYYNGINQDAKKLACDGDMFYDSVNHRRCCLSDTDSGTTRCEQNYIYVP